MKKYQIFLFATIIVNQNGLKATTTLQTNLQVQATVLASCSIVTQPTLLNFQNYTGALSSAQSSLVVLCTSGTNYHVLLGGGTSGNVNARTMTATVGQNSVSLPYALTKDQTGQNNWGQTPGTDDFTQAGSGSPQTIPIYGKINAGLTPQAGIYNDTVSVTINY